MSRPDSGALPPLNKPLHQPFSWLAAGAADAPQAGFLELTRNVCEGLQTCLQLIHSTDLELSAGADGDDVRPILGINDKESLLLLATAAVQMLGESAERRITGLNKHAQARGAK